MSRDTKIVAGVLGGVLVLCCCAALVTVGLGGYFFYETSRTLSTEFAPIFTEALATWTPTPRPVIVRTPVPTPAPGTGDTLAVLEAAVIPPSDLRHLAMRLRGIPDVPVTVGESPTDYDIGHELEFFASNTDTDASFQVTARLVYKTENVYFFAQTGLRVDEAAVRELVDDFQHNTYPTNRAFFGSEWYPGVDGDPRLYILYVRGLGASVAGYYSSSDQYSRLAHEYSNEKEMFYLNADVTGPGDPSLPGTLAHEFQHMIHWHQDRNEETWLNEGASVLAEFLNGHSTNGFDSFFLRRPDLQLNAWSEESGSASIPHYGAAFLFMAYFLDRLGAEATQALVAHPANGLRAVDAVLAELELADPVTRQPLSAVDVFADWVIANYLGDPEAADGRYAYRLYDDAPRVHLPTETLDDCPFTHSATVAQYGADYYEINCAGTVAISFVGSQQVRVIPAEPYSGRYAFWGHRNDESHTRLTREFDLSGVSTVTLTYQAWWAIEDNYDFAYLTLSADGGQTWRIIETPSSTDFNPTGNNFGWGYSGNSGGGGRPEWIEETVDLSEYAGQTVLLSFEYVTDAAVNRAGFLVDDITIPELGYHADFEADDGGWDSEGFVRMDNLLPQTFVVQVIRHGETTTVERLPLDAANTGQLTLDLAPSEKITLVISGTTPFTTEVASYQFGVR